MAHPRKFRFGVQLKAPLAGLNWSQTARRLEELGYSSVMMPDHFGDQLAPIVAMTAAAAATESLKVGSLVFDNDYRHPVVLAKEMATLDQMFPGRVEVGLGAGWMKSDYDESGIEMSAPKVRVDRLIESVEIVKGLWGNDPVTHDGAHYQITNLTGYPRPASTGGPAVVLAGGSPRMLRFAGSQADIVGVNPSIHSGTVDSDAARDSLGDRMDAKIEWVSQGAGDRFDDLEINSWVPVFVVTDDAMGVAQMLAPSFGIETERAADALDSPMTMIGTYEQIADRLRERRQRWGFSYHVVQTEDVEAFAPIVALLAGT